VPLQPRRAALWLAVAAIAAGGYQPVHAAEPVASAAAQVREEELLLFAVDLDGMTIADSLAAYGDLLDPLLPLGELARLLDLNLNVLPGDGRITGRIGEAERALTIDLASGLARVGGRDIALAPQDVAATPSEIYMRASAVSRLLPLTIEADPEALTLKLTAREKLPIQARLERIARLRELRPDVDSPEAVLRVETPYRLYSPPAFDVAIATAHDTRPPNDPRRYDIRVGADVLYTGFQGYLGSDEEGEPASARILFERHDVRGGLLGPLNATSATAGDTFTPAMPIGPRSVGGRGFAFTTAPLEQTSVFSRIDLRGELPLGYDVELYVNDILRSGQRTPVEGRYEFLQVPLARGLNVIRIVSYGPRGERSEQVRVVNVGGGQLKPGQTTFDFGVVQQETPVIELSGDDSGIPGPAEGKARVVALLTRGITEKLTMTAGAAYYPDLEGQDRSLITLGVRTSLAGLAVLADAAGDDQGGLGLALGLAGQPWGLSIIGRHAEYSGGFVDEANPAIQLGKPLTRHSEVTIDTSLRPGGRSIPLSMRASRDSYEDGGEALLAAARASTTFGTVLVSGGLDYRRDDNLLSVNRRLTGVLAASTFAAYRWQLRGALDYEVEPEARFSALTLTADRALTERMAVRFGLGHSFGEEETTSLQAAANFKLPYGDLAISGDYVTPDADWRVGIQFAFGLVHDPFARRYTMTRPGPASGGNVAFQAFIDRNGNGLFDPGEEPVSGVSVSGAEHPVTTTMNGRAFITGMGVTPTARVQVGLEEIDNPFVQSPPHTVEFAPRMGGVARVYYPLVPTGEVMARILYVQPDGRRVGLSAVYVRIIREGAEPVEGTTEFDGSIAFDALPAGTYWLELDPEQAKRLRMRLKSPVSFTVEPDGGYLADVQAEVVFEKDEEG
jgi:hypothetical protein